MKNLIIYKGRSQYNVLQHFADGLYKELKKLTNTELINMENKYDMEVKLPNAKRRGIDLTIAFNIAGIKAGYTKYNIPHLAIMVDHPIYALKEFDFKSKNLYISCTDVEKLTFLQSVIGFKNSFILNHAVDKDIEANISGEKNYDIVMLGSINSSNKIRRKLKEKYNKLLFEIIEDVTEVAVNNSIVSIEDLLDTIVVKRNLDMENVNMLNFYYDLLIDIESYVRSFSREKAIKSFSKYNLHVFGNCDGEAFNNSENIIVHNAVEYKEALEILKRSKVSLNSTKFMYNGSHERPLLSGACGSIILTNKTEYFRNIFNDSAIYYNDILLNESLEKIEEVLNKDKLRIDMARQANAIIMENHTWKNRAEQIVSML